MYETGLPPDLREELGLSNEFILPDLEDDWMRDVAEPPKKKSVPNKRKGNKSQQFDE